MINESVIMTGFPVPPESRIPLQDWDRAPWNRWAFQHIREILPTTEVWRGESAVRELPEQPAELERLRFKDAERKGTTIRQWLDSSFNDGFIVMHRGAIAFEQYRNGMTPRRLHLSQSVAKSVVACVVGVLIDKGLMDPEHLVTSYLPELEFTAYHGATLRDLLDMSSGVLYVEDYEALDSHIAMTDIASGWKPHRPEAHAPYCIWDQILSLTDSARAHGEAFEYRSIETDVIAHCMERVTSTRLADLVSEHLWQPLGVDENASFTVDRTGYALASGGFNACLRDYARFGQMLADGGKVDDRQVVPYDFICDTVDCKPDRLEESRRQVLPHGGYRNQFWLRDVDTRVMMARGVFGQLVYVDPDKALVVVILSSWPEFLSNPRSLTALNAIDRIADELAG